MLRLRCQNSTDLFWYKKIPLKDGEYAKPKVLHLTGEAESSVYIHGIRFHDVWKEAETRFEDKRYLEHFSKEQIAQMKQNLWNFCRRYVPKAVSAHDRI